MGVAKQKTKKNVHLICGKKREREGERDERDCRMQSVTSCCPHIAIVVSLCHPASLFTPQNYT